MHRRIAVPFRGILIAICASLSLSAAALPTESVPATIHSWFANEAVGYAHNIGEADGGTKSFRDSITLGAVQEVFGFTDAFASGKAGTALVPRQEWIAPATVNGAPVGTVSAKLDFPGAAPTGGLSTDTELAAALRDTSGLLITDPRSGEWFRLTGDRIAAVSKSAAVELPTPTTLSAFQTVIAKRYAAAQEASRGLLAPVGGSGPASPVAPLGTPGIVAIVGASVALVAGGAAVLSLRSKRRRSA